jgi:hypothetical protein
MYDDRIFRMQFTISLTDAFEAFSIRGMCAVVDAMWSA